METPQTTPAVYFQSLTIENVRCFKGEHTIDLSDGNGKPALWTVILGNNNTGKTTLLRCLYGLRPTQKAKWEDYYPLALDYHPTNFYSNPSFRTITTEGHVFYKIVATFLIKKDNTDFQPLQFKSPYKTGWDDEFRNNEWGVAEYALGGHATGSRPDFFSKGSMMDEIQIFAYTTARHDRRRESKSISEIGTQMLDDIFSSVVALTDAEDWLLQTYLASKNGVPKAQKRFDLICTILVEILPDVKNFTVDSDHIKFTNFVVAHTDFGEIPLKNLGYGYQSITAWIVDLAKRMVERYPDSENPLREPAIVLVDELELHLHPEWQRTIISFLSKHFPRTQFIVTTHSPLIVQSFEKVNLVVLHKNQEDDSVEIKQYVQQSFQGWTVEEILRDVMRMGERIYSNEYIQTRRDFDAALDNDNYAEAKRLRDKLKQMMNESNPIARVLDMQVAALNGVEHD